ncbi:MAG: hypothetical protein PHV60_00560 [bacterium]|nr:hypothetical protein [bacterium]
MTENKMAKRIEILLTPLLGAIMAAVTVKIQCEKIGVSPETLSIPDLPKLGDAIEKALVVFVGSKKAREVASSIKTTL